MIIVNVAGGAVALEFTSGEALFMADVIETSSLAQRSSSEVTMFNSETYVLAFRVLACLADHMADLPMQDGRDLLGKYQLSEK